MTSIYSVNVLSCHVNGQLTRFLQQTLLADRQQQEQEGCPAMMMMTTDDLVIDRAAVSNFYVIPTDWNPLLYHRWCFLTLE